MMLPDNKIQEAYLKTECYCALNENILSRGHCEAWTL